MTPKIHTGNELLDRVQDSLRSDIRRLEDADHANVRENLALSTAPTLIHHGLGQPVFGWRILRIDTGVVVHEGDETDDPARSINMVATGDCTVTIQFLK